MKPRNASLLLGVGLLLGSIPALALDPERKITQYVLDNWNQQHGLPVNGVDAIAQTPDGYLWVGSEDGLARFDGVRFTVFSAKNTAAFEAGDEVLDLHVDADDTLWIGTQDGLLRYRDGEFSRITTEDGLIGDWIIAVHVDRQGTLWAFSLDALQYRRNGTWHTLEEVTGNGRWVDIHECEDGTLWFTGDSLFRLEGGELTVLDEDDGLTGEPRSFAEAADGSHWIGTAEGQLLHLRDGTFTTVGSVEEPRSDVVNELLVDRDDNLWISILGSGLGLYSEGAFTFLAGEELSGAQVTAIHEDHEANLWVGTHDGGLARLKDGVFRTFSVAEGLSHPNVSAVYADRSGGVWIATTEGPLHRLDDGEIRTFTTEDGLSTTRILAIGEDRWDNVWFGTDGFGINRYGASGIEFFGRKDDVMHAVLDDGEEQLWVGTTGGVLLRPFDDLDKAYGILWGEGSITALEREAPGTVWVGSMAGWLKRVEGTEVTAVYAEDLELPRARVVDLHRDEQGDLWIAFNGRGLGRLRDGELTTYRARDGLGSDSLVSVLEDDDGHLWLGSNEGVIRVAKRELDEFDLGQSDSIRTARFSRADGVRGGECLGPSGASKGPDGRLWFVTSVGVAVVDPGTVKLESPPPVTVEAFLCDGRSIPWSADNPSPRLAAGTQNCEIHYTAMTLASPETTTFRYRLSGLHDWVDAETRRVAYFTNLPAGSHRFEVVAANRHGAWSETEATLSFHLQPRFYRTWWFYGLCGIAIVGLAGSTHRVRLARLEARQRTLTRMVEERTRELTLAQQELKQANDTLERRVQEGIDALRETERMAAYGEMVAGVAHEVRHPIFALQAAAYVLEDKLKQQPALEPQLKTLDHETKRMTRVMDDLLEFARPQELLSSPSEPDSLLQDALTSFRDAHPEHEIDLVLAAASELPRVVMDRDRLLQVLVNLMDNARKHAEGVRTITLSAEATDDGPSRQLRLRVANDGDGIPQEHLPRLFEPFFTSGRGTGLGLSIVKRIVDDHGGRISVESDPRGGTAFTIELPIEPRTGSG